MKQAQHGQQTQCLSSIPTPQRGHRFCGAVGCVSFAGTAAVIAKIRAIAPAAMSSAWPSKMSSGTVVAVCVGISATISPYCVPARAGAGETLNVTRSVVQAMSGRSRLSVMSSPKSGLATARLVPLTVNFSSFTTLASVVVGIV